MCNNVVLTCTRILCYVKFVLLYPKQALSGMIWFWLVRILLQTNEHWNDQDTVQ